MKKEIVLLFSLILVINLLVTIVSIKSEENQEIKQLIQNESGIIYGLSYRYVGLSEYDMKYGIHWSFSGVSDAIDVWLFDSYNFDRFGDGLSATGYHLCDAASNYISKSGDLQIPDMLSNWFLVFYNPHLLRISYNDLSCSVMEIHAKFDSVKYSEIDSDNDGFNDRLKANFKVSFDTTYWTEGAITVHGYLYNEEGKEVDMRNIQYEYIENSESFEITFQIHGTKGIYRAEITLFSFDRSEADDTDESSTSYKLYREGQLIRVLIWSCVGGGGAIVILIITILAVVSTKRKKRNQFQQTEDLQSLPKNLCPNCKNEIAETGHKFCEHCGAAL